MAVTNHKDVVITMKDMMFASGAFGWTLGFGYFVGLGCYHETRRMKRINTYIVMIWGELILCILFAILWMLYLNRVIPHCFAMFFVATTLWTIQVHFLFQIIVNRVGIIMPTQRRRDLLKYGVATFILAINVSVYCIWIPAQLDVNHTYHKLNFWWDRIEKGIFLLVDALLNGYFIYAVKKQLIGINSLAKYQPLVTFNSRIIAVSLAMDAFLIAMLSYENPFVYNEVQAVVYCVKLSIELAMSKLIVQVARESGIHVYDEQSSGSRSTLTQHTRTPTVEVQIETQTVSTSDHVVELKRRGEWSTKNDSLDSQDDLTESKKSIEDLKDVDLSEEVV